MSVTLTYTMSEADYLALKDAAASLSACSEFLPRSVASRCAEIARIALQVSVKPDVYFTQEIAA